MAIIMAKVERVVDQHKWLIKLPQQVLRLPSFWSDELSERDILEIFQIPSHRADLVTFLPFRHKMSPGQGWINHFVGPGAKIYFGSQCPPPESIIPSLCAQGLDSEIGTFKGIDQIRLVLLNTLNKWCQFSELESTSSEYNLVSKDNTYRQKADQGNLSDLRKHLVKHQMYLKAQDCTCLIAQKLGPLQRL